MFSRNRKSGSMLDLLRRKSSAAVTVSKVACVPSAVAPAKNAPEAPWFEQQVLGLESQVIDASMASLEEVRKLSQSFQELTVSETPNVISQPIPAVSSRRGVEVIRGAVSLQYKSAASMYRVMQTEEGMKLLDPNGFIMRMEYPIMGPFDLPQSIGRCHVEHLSDVDPKGRKELVHLVVYNELEYTVVFNSCLAVGVTGGSVYQKLQSTSMSNPRAVHSAEYRFVPNGENSCEMYITLFLDYCGHSTAAANNKRNKQMIKTALHNFSRFAGGKPRVSDDCMNLFS